MSSRRSYICLCALSFLASAGCGLAEYEAKMLYARDRIAFLEEQNKQLGPPLKWPETFPIRGKDVNIVPVNEVFFRPPRGVAQMGEPRPYGPTMWRYAAASDSGFQELYFGASLEDMATFRSEVLRILGLTGAKADPVEAPRGPGRPPLRYESIVTEDRRSRLILYIGEQEPYRAAIAFRLPADVAVDTAKPRMLLSLSSLLTGSDAAQYHEAFARNPPR